MAKSRSRRDDYEWTIFGRKKKLRADRTPHLDEALAVTVGRFFRWNRMAILAVFTVSVFGVLWAYGWSNVRQRVLQDDVREFTPDSIELRPEPPVWIRSDLRGEALRDASLDREISIFDDDLAEGVANAFAMHPWVAEVRRVEKRYPSRVLVDLVYRAPACMVEVDLGEPGLLPVDAQGALLPSANFQYADAKVFPRLSGVDTIPIGPVGTRWGDIRVAEGAKIAQAFGNDWNMLGLHRIVPEGKDEATGRYSYRLWTFAGTEIRWGAVDEASLGRKVRWLVDYFKTNGTLEGEYGPQMLDLSTVKGKTL